MRPHRRRILNDSASRDARAAHSHFLPSLLRGEGNQTITRSRRAGFTLLEMFVSVVVFGTALATFLPMMQLVGQQQRLTEQRLLALREADRQLEEITGFGWNELSTDTFSGRPLSDEAKSRLPHVTLKVEVHQPVEPPSSKRVVVQVNWIPRAGQASQSVRLAAWFFRAEEQP